MYYYVKNESGNVSDVTEEIYNRLKDNPAYECWKEDPYKELPKEVQQVVEKSTDYTVREATEKMSEMSDSEKEAFVAEDEDRKTILKQLD